MVENDKLKEKYLQFQLVQQQIEHLSQQVEILDHQQATVKVSLRAISTLATSPVGKELLAPIADGIFLKGELRDNQELIVNVGAGVAVEKSIPDVITLLKEQQKAIAEKVREGQNVLQELQQQAMKKYQEIEKSVAEEG